MHFYLVKEDANYADEFDLEGFMLFKSDADAVDFTTELIAHVKDGEEFPFEKYFGTNEYIEINNENDILSSLKVTKIKEQDYNTLLLLFPNADIYAFGTTALL